MSTKVLSLYDELIQEGIEKGFEKGLEKGIEKGLETGIEQGIETGIERGIEKTILNAHVRGFDLETIAVVTGESRQKVQEVLKRNGKM